MVGITGPRHGHRAEHVIQIEGHRFGTSNDSEQEAMLICSAEFIQVPEAVSPTFVGFKCLDEALRLIPNALYFSSVGGFKMTGVSANGK
jgi:hypothetical protein